MTYFHYKGFFTEERKKSLMIGIVIFALALIFQLYASAYTTRVSSNFVRDILLDNLPVVGLNTIIVEGAFIFTLFVTLLVISKPKYLIFSLKAGAIFIATRAMFNALTHLGIYPNSVVLDKGFWDNIYGSLGMTAGFFFSGHTGFPFLFALIFWNEKVLRYIFLSVSLLFGISVLLAHVHYSIDVFAAPYITYSIFVMSKYLFSNDYSLITEKTSN